MKRYELIALNQYLNEHPSGKEFSEIITLLEENSEYVVLYEFYEDCSKDCIASEIIQLACSIYEECKKEYKETSL